MACFCTGVVLSGVSGFCVQALTLRPASKVNPSKGSLNRESLNAYLDIRFPYLLARLP